MVWERCYAGGCFCHVIDVISFSQQLQVYNVDRFSFDNNVILLYYIVMRLLCEPLTEQNYCNCQHKRVNVAFPTSTTVVYLTYFPV